MSDRLRVLICGAGIGGLTAALAFVRGGAQVTVLEKAREISDVGAGIQQSPNAMAVHAALDTADDIIAAGVLPGAGIIRDFKRGRVKLRTQMKGAYEGRYGHPYVHIHRADLIDILRKHAVNAGADIRLSRTVTAYENRSDKVFVKTDHGNFTADILVGADGINSAIAAQMQGQGSARFTGQMAWRGLVDASDVSPGLIPKDASVWAGPGTHFVSYYVRGANLINFVAIKEKADWTEESWSKPGDVSQLRQAFKGWDKPVTELLNACGACFEWGLFDRPALPTWRDGRAVLLGDAAHPMLPFMAQGAAMAIEDSWALSQAVFQNSDIETALRRYERLRKPRATKLQNISKSNAGLFHAAGPAALARDAKLAAARALPFAQKMRFDPIYGYDITTVI